jgi:hypothetical protein
MWKLINIWEEQTSSILPVPLKHQVTFVKLRGVVSQKI